MLSLSFQFPYKAFDCKVCETLEADTEQMFNRLLCLLSPYNSEEQATHTQKKMDFSKFGEYMVFS